MGPRLPRGQSCSRPVESSINENELLYALSDGMVVAIFIDLVHHGYVLQFHHTQGTLDLVHILICHLQIFLGSLQLLLVLCKGSLKISCPLLGSILTFSRVLVHGLVGTMVLHVPFL